MKMWRNVQTIVYYQDVVPYQGALNRSKPDNVFKTRLLYINIIFVSLYVW